MTGTTLQHTEDPHPQEEILLLPGWPGYRTRDGRSGLDYLDTQYEMAHMAGLFLRKFFTNTWHRPGIDPHPLITLLVGAALWIAFPGNATVCPGVLIVVVVMLGWAVVKGIRSRSTAADALENEADEAPPAEDAGVEADGEEE